MKTQGHVWKSGCLIAMVLTAVGTVYTTATSSQPNYQDSILPKAFLNPNVLKQIKSIPDNIPQSSSVNVGASNGTTADLYYQGKRVLKGGSADSAYCSGVTFQVFMKACAAAAGENFLLKGISSSNIEMFRRDWYATDGNKQALANALVSWGLGQPIQDFENAAPGDFVQFWRKNGTGHSVVFLNWTLAENGKIDGIKYWSAASGKIGEGHERINDDAISIDSHQIFIVRAYAP